MQNLGGAQEILVELASRLNPQQFSQTIVRLHGKNSYESRLPLDRIDSFSLSSNKYDLPKILWGLYRHLKANHYNIIHLHLQISTLLGVLIARLCAHSKIVVTIYASKEQSSCWIFPMFALLTPFVDAFVGLTQHQLSGLTQHPLAQPFLKHTKTELIPVGLDLEVIDHFRQQTSTIREELHLPPDSPLIVNIARFHYRKGQDYLLRAIAMVVKEFPNAHCILVGHGPELPRLQALTRELQLERHVSFLISRSDLHNFLNAADLFVNASIYEGMGVILYQTMAYGKAIVGFNTGSADEVVIHGETGLLAQVRDYHALADGMITLLKNPELRQKFGQQGRQRIEEYFQLRQKTQAYEAVYQALYAD